MKALQAGKHVLLEKPAANTAEETSQMFELADKKGLVLLEAFHYRYDLWDLANDGVKFLNRFHPAIQRVKAILDSEELGRIKSISTKLSMPTGLFKRDDIRYNYELGGGGMMDMGCESSIGDVSGHNYFRIQPRLYSPLYAVFGWGGSCFGDLYKRHSSERDKFQCRWVYHCNSGLS
jgi:hypothetical protein